MLAGKVAPVTCRASQGYQRVRKGVGSTTPVTLPPVTSPSVSSPPVNRTLCSGSTDEWGQVDYGTRMSAPEGV